MGDQMKTDIFQMISSKGGITDPQSSRTAYDTANSFPSDLPESETEEATGASSAGGYTAPLFGDMKEDENEQNNNLNFFKSTYNPDNKKFTAAYYIVDDSSDKFIEILNIQEIYPRKSTYGDGAEPYRIKIHNIKLPKSQINILDQDTGFENFKFIEIPYWLVKKNIDDFKIVRKDIFKRLELDKLNKDAINKDVIKYIKTTDKDKNSQKWIEFFGNLEKKVETKEDYHQEANLNIQNVFDSLPKLKDLKKYGLKYSVKSIKNLLQKKTRSDGIFRDNKWIRDEMPFSEDLDILNALLHSRLAKYYFTNTAKKRDSSKGHYYWVDDIKKEDLDNLPIPQLIFDGVINILKDKENITKVETKEATGSSSSGSYVTPKIWAKSSTKKDWRGAKKTQIPGGKFVEVKRKCQKYPYCNQGDIKALKIFENERIKEVIKNVSKKHNISESVIKNILRDNLHIFRNYKK